MKMTNLIKRMVSYVVLCTVMLTMVTIPAMAEDTQIPEGKEWKVLTEIDMDGFTLDSESSSSEATWGRKYNKTVNGIDYSVSMVAEGSDNKFYGGKWSSIDVISSYTASADALTVNAPSIIKNNKVAMVDRYYNNSSGAGLPSSGTRFLIGNVLGCDEVSVGDTVKITAWVFGGQFLDMTGNPVTGTQNFTTRMWMGADSTSTMQTAAMTSDMWQEMNITFTVTDAILNNSALKIDNYVTSGVYPGRLYLAGVKLEKLVDVADVDAGEIITEIDMAGFTLDSGSNAEHATWGRKYNKTVDGKNYYINMTAEGSDNKFYIGKWSTIEAVQSSLADEFAVNKPSIIKDNMVALLDRGYNDKAPGLPSSGSRFIVGDLFTGDDVAVGDTVKITAWVLGRSILDVSGNSIEGVQNFSTRMWVGGDTTTMQTETMTSNQWQKISVTLEITENLISNPYIKIDNYVTSGYYPSKLFLAGVRVEKMDVSHIVTKLDMDGFTLDSGSNAEHATWGRTYNKTVNGIDYSVSMVAEGSDNKFYGGKWSNIDVISSSTSADELAVNPPSVMKNNKVAMVDRYYNDKAPGLPSSGTRFAIGNVLSGDKVSVGDTVKITAWVFGGQILDMTGNPVTGTQNFTTRMWMGADSTSSMQTAAMTSDIWQEMNITFTVTDAILNDSTLKIDNYVTSGVYPGRLYLAGIVAEKVNNEGTYSMNGSTATGSVTIKSVSPAEGIKVIVAAYKGVQFINCDIIDFVDSEIPFSIENVSEADSLRAFVWNEETLSPYTGVIPVTVKQ